jgi:hypothetical protein
MESPWHQMVTKTCQCCIEDLNPLDFNVGDYLFDDVKVLSPTRNPLTTFAPETPMVAVINEDNTTSLIVVNVATLALGLRPRQGFTRVRAKRETRE